MSLLSFFRGHEKPSTEGAIRLAGNGAFDLAVVGQDPYDDDIASYYSAHCEDGGACDCYALLTPDYSAKAAPEVAVSIEGHPVGRLSPKDAARLCESLANLAGGRSSAVCAATIVPTNGRAERPKCGIRLDVTQPLRMT